MFFFGGGEIKFSGKNAKLFRSVNSDLDTRSQTGNNVIVNLKYFLTPIISPFHEQNETRVVNHTCECVCVRSHTSNEKACYYPFNLKTLISRLDNTTDHRKLTAFYGVVQLLSSSQPFPEHS